MSDPERQGRTARGSHLAAEFYERKAQQCMRLRRRCTDPVAIETLARLAQEYMAMALTLRNKKLEGG
jgi:hypothetical protein